MPEQIYLLKQKDGHKTRIHAFLCDTDTASASLLILHGMAEHHERYVDFAHILMAAGIDVYLYDHRGHGKDTKQTDLGHLAASKGYRKLVCDALAVAAVVRKKKRTDSFFIMGHSMGSLVTRCLLQREDDFTGALICGSTWPSAFTCAIGLAVSKIICSLKGAQHPSPFMNHILFENYQYKKLSTHTAMDWLTQDETVVRAYLKDPYCGYLCSASFYHDLIKLSLLAGHPARMLRTRKDLPLLFTSGDHDPVGGYGKQVKALSDFYKKHGYSDVTCKLYPKDRHEILNELDKENVMSDMINWIQMHVKNK